MVTHQARRTPRQRSPAHHELQTVSTSGLRSRLISPIPTRRFPTARSSSCCPHRRPPTVARLILNDRRMDVLLLDYVELDVDVVAPPSTASRSPAALYSVEITLLLQGVEVHALDA
eukprot:4229695-Heterocapsa_arctica.AAC.1